MLNNVNKIIGLLWKLQNTLSTPSLLTIYKSFTRPHLDYGDIIYSQAYNAFFQQKVESIQYNAPLVITGATREISNEKLFKELGCFYKILKDQSPKYLFNIIPKLTGP